MMEVELSINYQERIIDKAKPMEEAINKIVTSHIGDLQTAIKGIRNILNDKNSIITDVEIDDILLQLPILLFEVTKDQELVGMQCDLASQIYKESYSEAYKLARGTVAERSSVAELTSMQNKLDEIIFSRAYKIIKQQIDMAVETLNAVKKIQASRQQRNNVGNTLNRF